MPPPPEHDPGLTEAGKQAYQILEWAQADLRRVPKAKKRMRRLALALIDTPGRALDEVQDAGTMLGRLTPPAT